MAILEKRYIIDYDILLTNTYNIEFQEGDTDSSIIEVHLLNNNIPIDVSLQSIEFRFLKQDNTAVYQDLTTGVSILSATNGYIVCALKNNTLACPGIVELEIYRSLAGVELTTCGFNFLVKSSIDGAVISTNFIGPIDTLTNRIIVDEGLITGLTTRVGNSETAITGLTTRTGNSETAITGLISRAGTDEGLITGLTTRVGNSETAITGLTTRVGNSETAITNLTTAITDSTKQLTIAAVTNVYTLDLQHCSNFTIETLDTNAKTITLINIPQAEDNLISLAIRVIYTNAVVFTFPTIIAWQNGLIPVFTTTKKYWILLQSRDKGVNWIGSYSGAW